MNLAYAVHAYDRDEGTSGYVVELVTRFASSHEITVYTTAVRTPPPAGVRVVRVPALRNRTYATAFTFPIGFAAVRGRHDVVHAQGWVTGAADVVTAHIVLAAWRRAARVAGGPTPTGERCLGAVAELFERGLIRRAARVIVPSERARVDVAMCYGRERGVAVIHHGCDRPIAPAPRLEARRALGLPADAFVALYAGDARKGAAAAIDAIERVRDTRLLVLSHSPPGPYLAGALETTRSRIHWAPSGTTVASAFGAADVLLHPSIYDTFGLVVAEAMTLGVPAVVSREAGASEMVEHGVSGWLLAAPTGAATAEALEALVGDAALRRRLAEGGKAAAARRTWDQVAAETLEVYAGIAAAKIVSRTARFLGGLWIGVISQGVMTLVGLWLTRFTLHHLGASTYGLWLVGLQVATYLGLLDIGVVALLPRETAYAAGREAEGEAGAVAALLARVTRLVVWQWPVAVGAALAGWALAAAHWPGVGPVLGVLLVVTVLLFPFRLLSAALTGLQDLAFLGRTQLAAWLLGAAVTVALLLAGFGLWAVAAGWIAGQTLPPVVFGWRLRRHFREQLPRRLPPVPWTTARTYLAKSLWVSLSQVTVQIVYGADVLVVAAVLGPRAVVAYTCTVKLAMVAGNLPLMIPQIAAPALSELRVRETGARLRDVTTALTQAILLAGGLIAVVIVVVNEGFVGWWVGPAQFGGQALSLLAVCLLLLHDYSTALLYSVFSFGHERALALIGGAQAAVALAAMVLLVPRLGLAGAPLGGIVGELLVAIPLSLWILTRQVGGGVGALLVPLAPWALRTALLIGAGVASLQWWRARSLVALIATAFVATAAYALLMRSQLRREPLAPYLARSAGRFPPRLQRLLLGSRAA